jgi:hypothetical protein
MSIKIVMNGETIFSTDSGENVLVPFDEDERAKAFHALSGALAVLCGVMPLCQSSSTASVTDQYCSETEQCQGAQSTGVVVPLRALLVGRNETPTLK